jgi:hypothetical protein
MVRSKRSLSHSAGTAGKVCRVPRMLTSMLWLAAGPANCNATRDAPAAPTLRAAGACVLVSSQPPDAHVHHRCAQACRLQHC